MLGKDQPRLSQIVNDCIALGLAGAGVASFIQYVQGDESYFSELASPVTLGVGAGIALATLGYHWYKGHLGGIKK